MSFFKVKNQLALVLSNVGAALINGVFWIYLASILQNTEYGEIGFWISAAEIGFSFASLGLPGMVTVFGAKKEKVLRPAYEIGLISSSIVAIGIFVITDNLAVSFLVVGSMILSLWQAELNSEKRYLMWSFYHILRRTLVVILVLIFFYIFGTDGIVWGFFLSTLPSFIGLRTFLKEKRPSLSILKPKFEFLSHYYLSLLTKNLFWWGDKIIIGSMLGFAILGSYQLATQFVGLLYTIPIALGVYLLPQEAQGTSNKKLKIYSLAGICLIILFSIMIIPSIINNFFVNYLDSILPIQIMLIGIIPLTISTIFESMLLGKEKSNHILYGTILQTGTFFILLISFVNKLGLIEIAIFFLLSIIIKSVYVSVITKLKIL